MRKNKQIVRLTESQLHNIIAESVKKILKETREKWHYATPEERADADEYSWIPEDDYQMLKNYDRSLGVRIGNDGGYYGNKGLDAYEKYMNRDRSMPGRRRADMERDFSRAENAIKNAKRPHLTPQAIRDIRGDHARFDWVHGVSKDKMADYWRDVKDDDINL